MGNRSCRVLDDSEKLLRLCCNHEAGSWRKGRCLPGAEWLTERRLV